MVEQGHPQLSVRQQCILLEVNRNRLEAQRWLRFRGHRSGLAPAFGGEPTTNSPSLAVSARAKAGRADEI